MKVKLRRLVGRTTVLAVAAGAAMLVAGAAVADHGGTHPLVTPTVFAGNPKCVNIDATLDFEIKVDPPVDGTYGPLTVDFYSYDGGGNRIAGLRYVSFSSTVPVLGVFVKGGTAGGNFYDYRPGGVTYDEDLEVPTGQNISHVSFCWDDEPVPGNDVLSVEKTATGTWDRTITWTLDKSVAPDSHSGAPGDTFSSDWTVDVTKTDSGPGNFQVTGTITISNPNAFAVPVEVFDTLDDGTVATVDCGAGTNTGNVPAGGNLVCSYTASPADASALDNNALVVSGNPDVPGGTALEPIAWSENLTGDEETLLEDDEGPLSATLTGSDSFTYPGEFECPTDLSLYENFTYEFSVVNTATLTGDNTNLSDDATVTVTCRIVLAGETATGEGPGWPGANWFMYSAFDDGATINLIAGQHYDAGDITFSRNGTTCITIDLHAGFYFAGVSANVKIHPMNTAPTKYLAPGKFSVKATIASSESSATICGLANTTYYGIHVDVLRAVL